MTEFYDIIGNLKTVLQAQPFVNTVTTGGLEDVDLNKQTIFPLSHIIVNSAIPKSSTIVFNISIIAMDIVDESKSETEDIFVGNDNEQDVLNQQLQVLNQVYQQLRHGQLFSELIQVEVDPNCEPFTDRFENKLAGWTMTFDVEVPNDMTICGTSIPSNCLDAFVQNSDGSFSVYLASGSHTTLDDITVELYNTNETLIDTIVQPSNKDFQYEIPDTQIVLKDTDANIISTTDFPSAVSSDLIAPDAHLRIKKSNGVDISEIYLPAGSDTIQTISDSVITLKDSSGTTISTTNVKATDTENITAPNSTIQINGKTVGTAKSNETKNFNFKTAKLMATGQTTSYATGDDGNLQLGRNFLTLTDNNPFGNTNRFTALNGTQTYSNDIVLDWATYDGQTVLGWYRIPQGNAITWANALSGANAISIIGYSGWRLPNINELMSIGIFSQIDMFNYSPFNILNKLIWTSTTALANTANAYRTSTTGFMTNGSKTATNTGQCYIPCRNFTNAELGI